jgi:hypothetical protein
MGVSMLDDPKTVTEESAAAPLYCAYHPGRETVLRCNRCGNPMCNECAVHTPVGYRCKQCVRSQQATYYTGGGLDLPLAAVVGVIVAAALGAVAFLVLGFLGFFRLFGAIFGGPLVGGMVAEAVRFSIRRRRARYLGWVAAAACVAGVLLGVLLLPLLSAGLSPRALALSLPLLISRFDMLILAFLAASTVYARLR